MAMRRVVVGVDGSDPSMAAVRWAAEDAAARPVPLRLVHAEAALPGDRQAGARGSLREEWVGDRIDTAWREAARRHPDLEISGGETTETAVKALLEAAQEGDLLVLGSRGIGAAAGFFTGSVALPVVAHASVPTVLVREDWYPDTDRDLPVVVGVDPAHRCDPVLEFAFETAHRSGSPLRVLHMWRRSSVYAYPSALPDPKIGADLATEARQKLDAALGTWQARYPGVPTERELLDGEVAPRLLEQGAGARLLVGGRRLHRHRRFPTLIGPVTHALMHHAIAPVAVVPHE
ncbi:universal stress protein [Streptomyces sp. WMMC500]|uniref:universal stress protein n=1 Tax=Streptomyces sp. WMMC500 TaxID=3015154 RepID=UPI00248B186E|nr:universal stress protein [Streptomyces sp. WMMC500]WBB61744.1 universal stress protein [Streptomyces sp. WMMC500]